MTGRSMLSAGTTTRVATRSANGVGDALGEGDPDDGGNVGRSTEGVGPATMIVGDGCGRTISAAPVYVNRPPAMRDTPVAVRIADRRRLRNALLSLPTGPAS